MKYDALATRVAAGNEVNEMMDLIGWDEKVLPVLEKRKSQEQELLVNMTLNRFYEETHKRTTAEVAGVIYGINILIATMNNIIHSGMDAEKALNSSLSATKK